MSNDKQPSFAERLYANSVPIVEPETKWTVSEQDGTYHHPAFGVVQFAPHEYIRPKARKVPHHPTKKGER